MVRLGGISPATFTALRPRVIDNRWGIGYLLWCMKRGRAKPVGLVDDEDKWSKVMHVREMNGIVPALLTPFSDGGQVNEPVLRQMVRHMLALGASGFYVCGSTGEGLSLSAGERKAVVETVKAETGDRAGVIVNISHLEYQVVLDLAQHAQDAGADAVSTLPPLYYPVSDEELLQYYLRLLEEVALPLTLYNIPGLTKRSLDESTFARLAEHPRFVGVKHSSQDTALLNRFKQIGGERIMIWSARDAYYVSALAMGADGAIGTSYNLAVDLFVEITRAFRGGDLARARAIQSAFNMAQKDLYKYGAYGSVKRCLSLMGIEAGDCRPPFLPLGSARDEHLRQTLRQLDDIRDKWGLPVTTSQ